MSETQKVTLTNIRHPELENHHCLQINRLDARSVLIPAHKAGVYYKNKEDSVFLQSLNGDYDFCYQPSDTCPDFYKENYCTSSWDKIDVPSMWQYRGYGKCTYPNVQYPMPFNPPYIETENPVGYYKRTFELKKTPRTILHFGGVDNAFYAYVNGQFVGFSKGSRIPCEFDISDVARDGTNTLCVKVFTYSDSSYLENQDMLMANGIFRDVYLLNLSEDCLWDYRVTTTMSALTVSAELFHGENSNATVRLTLDGQTVTYPISDKVVHTFELENPRLWNAEEPNLYDLTIELSDGEKVIEVHSKRVGIMHTKCVGNKFLVNGKPIYIKGVNRHEHDCKNGRAVSVSLIEKELRMIKENNLNAIRCSHYTNNPAFYEIASELGIYVMDEADLETHGAEVTGNQGYLSDDPDWFDAYIDRTLRMIKINKNEPCIFMWSLGNECGNGQNLIKCYDILSEYDPTKEVFYSQEDAYNPPRTKFVRDGYCTLVHMKTYEPYNMPLMLVEYAHAMGNSPGFLQGYQDYIYSAENACGGFVWEFKSHGFYKEENCILYGGDFDDRDSYNWYNFCLDGYLKADGTPKPCWFELGEVMAPIYVQFDGDIILRNTNDFKDASYLLLKWELLCDTDVIKSGSLNMPKLAPHESVRISSDVIDYTVQNPQGGAKYYINLHFYDGQRKISTKQIELCDIKAKKPVYVSQKAKMAVASTDNSVTVMGNGFEVTIQKGVISCYKKDGNVLIDAPMEMSFYRAPTDNDGIIELETWFSQWFRRRAGEWDNAFLNSMKFHCTQMAYEQSDESVKITSGGIIIVSNGYRGFDAEFIYTVLPDGVITVEMQCEPFGKMPQVLPRMGVCFTLPKSYDNVKWYGRGKDLSYCDFKQSAPIGLYKASVQDMNYMFDMPQETGNHEDTAYVTLTSYEKPALSFIALDTFSFSYHDFTLTSLKKALHANELCKAENNYLYLDYKMRGLGSHSCGPEPEEQYELRPHSFRFAFAISPSDDADVLCRYDFGVEPTKALSDTYVEAPSKKRRELAACSE